jgi:hypothetical protein
MEKDKWIEEVLASTDGISRAEVDGIAAHVIEQAMNPRRSVVSDSFVWRMAASVALLLMINVVTIYMYRSQSSKIEREASLQMMAKEYGFTQSNYKF